MEQRRLAWLLAGTALFLVLFADRAINIDDVLVVRSARAILADPWRPYDVSIDWYGHGEAPLWEVYKNPPLLAYWLAPWLAISGGSVVPLHLALIPFALLALAGMHRLARRMTDRPFAATLLLALSPAFGVSALTLMPDVPLLAFFTWGIVLFLEGSEAGWPGRLLLAGAALGLACLTKYYAVTALPLLAVWLILSPCRTKPGPWAALLIPFLFIGAWGLQGFVYHGQAHFLASASYHLADRLAPGASLYRQAIASFTFLALTVPAAVLSLCVAGRRAGAAAALTGGVLYALGLLLGPDLLPEDYGPWGAAAIGGAFCLGLYALAEGLAIAWRISAQERERRADAVLLGLWLLGMVLFGAGFYWTAAAKVSLLAAPPLTLLVLTRRTGGGAGPVWMTVLLFGLLTLGLAWVDRAAANVNRLAAREAAGRIAALGLAPRRVWFTGHWGWQYYMEKEGLRCLPWDPAAVEKGDLILYPRVAANRRTNPALTPRLEQLAAARWEEAVPLRVMNSPAGAGFYSHVFGLLPWTFSTEPLQKMYILRVKD